MTKPGISIVIPAFNEEKFLPAALASIKVAQQKLADQSGAPGIFIGDLPTEVIVVNNASTDRTEDIGRALGAKVVNHSIRNISSVRNAGIRTASFDWIVTIDADSTLSENALVEVVKVMRTGAIGGAFRVKVITHRIEMRIVAFIVQTVVRWMSGISGAMFFFSREEALQIGGFPEDRLVAEDGSFANSLRSLGKERGQKFVYLKSATVGTLDRKEMNLTVIIPAVIQGFRGFFGRKQSLDQLKYWYEPNR
jgi:glycosyltransferase involved in cell wall biosynthesis